MTDSLKCSIEGIVARLARCRGVYAGCQCVEKRVTVVAAPAKTPPEILDKLNAEIGRILGEPDVKERLTALAFTPVPGTRAEFAAYIRAEIAKWGKAVKDSGARVD